MSRRYEIGEKPIYDQQYDFRLNQSATGSIGSKVDAQRRISEGQARAEQIQEEIEAINLKFENVKVTARREGRPEPAEMPQELRKERLELEAELDVIPEKAAQFEEILAKIEAREQAEQDAKILQYGPVGHGKLRDGILSMIDGQPIRVNRKGILIISCKKSPYDGMLVADYRLHIAAPFAKARAEKSREYEDAIAEKERELRELKKLKPNLEGVIARGDLPPRPPGV
jgi:hypothetical protein